MTYLAEELALNQLPLVAGDQCQLTVREISFDTFFSKVNGMEPANLGNNKLKSGDSVLVGYGNPERYFQIHITSCCL
jgi:hypothetical protein